MQLYFNKPSPLNLEIFSREGITIRVTSQDSIMSSNVMDSCKNKRINYNAVNKAITATWERPLRVNRVTRRRRRDETRKTS